MTHRQSEVDELTVTRTKLEQALKELAEKDLQIAVLTDELAGLRRVNSPKTVIDGFHTTSGDFGFDRNSNGDGFMPETLAPSTPPCSPSPEPSMTVCHVGLSQEEQTTETLPFIEDQEAIQAAFNERYGTIHQETVSGAGDWPGTYYDPPTEGLDDGSPMTSDWKNDCTASWDNPTSSWGKEWSDSPGPADAVFKPGEPPNENWRDSILRPESKSWLHSLSFGKPAHTLTDEEFKDLLDLHVLPLTTRLADDDWLDSDLGNIRVDDERLFRLLTRGRELAQKCLWSFMDKNRPDTCQREFPGGWQQVKLEVSALLDILNMKPFALGLRQNQSELARNALFAVVPLRHLTCHWNQSDLGWFRPAPRVVDGHLKNVQKLAIHFYDEECAAEARQLRDEARQAAEDTVRDMEAFESLFDEYEWKYHHQQMFEQIKYARDMKTPELFRYPDVVFRAAEAWSRRRPSSDQAFEDEQGPREETNAVRNQCPDQRREDHANAGKKNENTIAKHLPVIGLPNQGNSVPFSETAGSPSITAGE